MVIRDCEDYHTPLPPLTEKRLPFAGAEGIFRGKVAAVLRGPQDALDRNICKACICS